MDPIKFDEEEVFEFNAKDYEIQVEDGAFDANAGLGTDVIEQPAVFEGFLSEYQLVARTFALPQIADNLFYMALKLGGETGEFQEKIGKALRDDAGVIDGDKLVALGRELGDILWYVANAASILGFDLEEIASDNLNKLHDRKERGVIQGSGDQR